MPCKNKLYKFGFENDPGGYRKCYVYTIQVNHHLKKSLRRKSIYFLRDMDIDYYISIGCEPIDDLNYFAFDSSGFVSATVEDLDEK